VLLILIGFIFENWLTFLALEAGSFGYTIDQVNDLFSPFSY
jgi:hypothetical protein